MPDVILASDTNPGGRKYNEDRVEVQYITNLSGLRLAVAWGADAKLNYGELADRSLRIASALAARGVVTFRELAGRKPTDDERRAIWAGLWRAAEETTVGG